MTTPNLNQDQVRHIASLCRIGLSDQDVELFTQQLSSLLEHFQVLEEVNTDYTSVAEHQAYLQNVMREDIAAKPLPKSDVLANAPSTQDDFFKVKAILE